MGINRVIFASFLAFPFSAVAMTGAINISESDIEKLSGPGFIFQPVKADLKKSNGDYKSLLKSSTEAREHLNNLTRFLSIYKDLPEKEKLIFQLFDIKNNKLSELGADYLKHFKLINKEHNYLRNNSKISNLTTDVISLVRWIRSSTLNNNDSLITSKLILSSHNEPLLKELNIINPSDPHKKGVINTIVWQANAKNKAIIIHMYGLNKQQCNEMYNLSSVFSYKMALNRKFYTKNFCKRYSNVSLIV